MPEKKFGNFTVEVDENGYLVNMDDWSEELAKEIAKEIGIELTEDHMKVIKYIREKTKAGESLSIRKIGKSGIVSIKEFYQLFPDGPLKKASLIAGVSKPAGCV